jgi:hypothetical protein
MYYTNPYVTIEYDSKLKCIRTVWKGYVKDEYYREAWEKCLELSVKQNCNKWLHNQQEQKVSDPSDRKWLLDDFYNRVEPTIKGQIHIAVISSKDIFLKTITSEIIKFVLLFKPGGKAINFKMLILWKMPKNGFQSNKKRFFKK